MVKGKVLSNGQIDQCLYRFLFSGALMRENSLVLCINNNARTIKLNMFYFLLVLFWAKP